MNIEKIRDYMVQVILQFAIPSIIAMVLTSLITIADGFFVGNYVGEDGIAAINLGLPILYLYLAVGIMISVGGMAISGMLLGSGEQKKSNNVFNQTMAMVVTVTVGLSILFAIFFEPTMKLLHIEEQLCGYFKEYYRIMLVGLPIMVMNSSFGMFIRGEGNPQYFMKVSVISVVCNIFLDYLFVRWFGWGVKGIAAASLVSVTFELLLIIFYFIKRSKVYKFAKFTFMVDDMKNMFLNGSSEFIGEMSMCISMFAYNMVIMKYVGVDGVAAFTIVGYIAYLFSMIIIGFGQGASPLISFTFGAKEEKLAIAIRKKTNQFVFGIGVVFILLMILSANWYSHAFVKSESVIEMVHSGIIIFVFSFLFSGINTITSFYFTSIGCAKESAVISSARGLVILLICILIFPAIWGITGVWLISLVTEGLTILISFYFINKNDKKQRA